MQSRASFRRGGALIVAIAIAGAPAIVAAQPLDPYAPAPTATPPKAPKAPKAKPEPKGKGKAKDAEPVDPYAGPTPTPPPNAPQDPYAGPTPTPPPNAPQDPYAQPTPAPAPVTDEQAAEIDEAVAAALVARAHHLLDVQAWADAKQLAVEALVRSPNGASSADAKQIVRAANQRLGIVDVTPTPVPPTETADAQVDKYLTPTDPAITSHPEGRVGGTTVLGSYGLAGGALLGLGVVGAADGVSDGGSDAAGAILGGLAGGAAGYWLGAKYDISMADARTIGAGATWGAAEFGLLTDAVGGTNEKTTHDEVFVGASIGLALGTLGGVAYANQHSLSAGDVTMVDSLAGMGVVGGLTIGELMQPYASEAYSLNAAIGAAGGVAVGLWLAPDHDVSTSRMLRIDGVAAIGAGAPWLLYAAVSDSSTTGDERAFGLLSTAGLVAGAYFGWRWTRDDDDKPAAAKRKHDRLQIGALGVRPATTSLAPTTGRGLVVDLLRGSF